MSLALASKRRHGPGGLTGVNLVRTRSDNNAEYEVRSR
jgi:hypothetical protein